MPESKNHVHDQESLVEETTEKLQDATQAETVPPQVSRTRTLAFLGFLIAAFVAFILLAILSRTVLYFPIDLAISLAFQSLDVLGLAWLMRWISWPGFNPQAAIITVALILLLYASGLRWEALVTAGTSLAAHSLNLLVKVIVQRPRPSPDLVEVIRQLADFSFPSGHVMVYTAFYGFLWFLSYSLLKPSWKRSLLLVVFGALVLLVGPSRIYLGHHWASDVLGGHLFGGLILVTAVLVYRWGKTRFFTGQPIGTE